VLVQPNNDSHSKTHLAKKKLKMRWIVADVCSSYTIEKVTLWTA
jgi:hypothetical protein